MTTDPVATLMLRGDNMRFGFIKIEENMQKKVGRMKYIDALIGSTGNRSTEFPKVLGLFLIKVEALVITGMDKIT